MLTDIEKEKIQSRIIKIFCRGITVKKLRREIQKEIEEEALRSLKNDIQKKQTEIEKLWNEIFNLKNEMHYSKGLKAKILSLKKILNLLSDINKIKKEKKQLNRKLQEKRKEFKKLRKDKEKREDFQKEIKEQRDNLIKETNSEKMKWYRRFKGIVQELESRLRKDLGIVSDEKLKISRFKVMRYELPLVIKVFKIIVTPILLIVDLTKDAIDKRKSQMYKDNKASKNLSKKLRQIKRLNKYSEYLSEDVKGEISRLLLELRGLRGVKNKVSQIKDKFDKDKIKSKKVLLYDVYCDSFIFKYNKYIEALKNARLASKKRDNRTRREIPVRERIGRIIDLVVQKLKVTRITRIKPSQGKTSEPTATNTEQDNRTHKKKGRTPVKGNNPVSQKVLEIPVDSYQQPPVKKGISVAQKTPRSVESCQKPAVAQGEPRTVDSWQKSKARQIDSSIPTVSNPAERPQQQKKEVKETPPVQNPVYIPTMCVEATTKPSETDARRGAQEAPIHVDVVTRNANTGAAKVGVYVKKLSGTTGQRVTVYAKKQKTTHNVPGCMSKPPNSNNGYDRGR